MKLDTVDPDSGGDRDGGRQAAPDRWYVTNGTTSVGPVNLDLIARGVEAGKVPTTSFVRHEAWKVWRPLTEIAVVTDDGLPPTDDVLASTLTDDIMSLARPATLADMTPSDALAATADLHDGMLFLLTAVVQRLQADAALVHRVEDHGLVVMCAHGPDMVRMLGHRTRLVDPVVTAAAAGVVVVAEPVGGPAGTAIRARMAQLGVHAEGAFMVPLRLDGRLVALLEVGRRSAFTVREIGRAEDLVEALVTKAVALGWSDSE